MLRKAQDRWRHSPEIVERIRQMALTMTDEQIMTQFYQEELKTNKGNIFTINSIKWIRFKHKIPSINLIKEGEFSINQIVEKFNVSHHVVRYWIDKGIVQARFIKTKIWISLDDTKENELKQRAEKAIKRLALLSKTLNKIERGTL